MRRLLLPLLLVLVCSARPASASCLPPGPLPERLADAPVVFVGTVLSTDSGDRVARVRVEEVWQGPDLPDAVEMRGTPFAGGERAATSVDRTFRPGARYLFVPHATGDNAAGASGPGVLEDGLCTATQEYRAELERFRPASGGDASPAPAAEGRGVVVTTAAAVLAALVALVALVAGAVMAGGRRERGRQPLGTGSD